MPSSSMIAHKIEDKIRTDDIHITESVDFSGLLLSPPVLEGLNRAGFKRPSPIQLEAIPLGRCGLDLIVQAKSGTGKTCVFTVIALEGLSLKTNAVQVLILAPTREIAIQINSVVSTIGSCLPELKCHSYIGGTSLQDDKTSVKQCHVAVGTPGRIKQLIELGLLKTGSIRLFVLDEADKLLDGSFTETINWIYSSLPSNKQMVALSATYPEILAEHLTRYMRNPTFVRLNITDPALIGIRQYHVIVPDHPLANKVFDAKTEAVVNILSSVSFQQCLIFSNLQTRAQNLQSELHSRGWPTECIAGCLDQKDRSMAMEQLKSYNCRVLISTDLTARGIDADKVNMVINLDVPKDHETYLHRIGRAGRFGSYGAAISIVSKGGQERELWAVERKCGTHIPKLPEPIPSDLVLKSVAVKLSDVVTTETIITRTGDKGNGDDSLEGDWSSRGGLNCNNSNSNHFTYPPKCQDDNCDENSNANVDLTDVQKCQDEIFNHSSNVNVELTDVQKCQDEIYDHSSNVNVELSDVQRCEDKKQNSYDTSRDNKSTCHLKKGMECTSIGNESTSLSDGQSFNRVGYRGSGVTIHPQSCDLGREVGSCDVGREVGSCDVGREVGSCDVGREVGSCDVGIEVGSCDVAREVGSCDVGREVGSCDLGREVESCDLGREVGSCDVGIEVGSCDVEREVGSCDLGRELGSYDVGREVGSCDVGRDVGSCDLGREVGSCDVGRDVGSCDVGREVGSCDVGKEVGSCDLNMQKDVKLSSLPSNEFVVESNTNGNGNPETSLEGEETESSCRSLDTSKSDDTGQSVASTKSGRLNEESRRNDAKNDVKNLKLSASKPRKRRVPRSFELSSFLRGRMEQYTQEAKDEKSEEEDDDGKSRSNSHSGCGELDGVAESEPIVCLSNFMHGENPSTGKEFHLSVDKRDDECEHQEAPVTKSEETATQNAVDNNLSLFSSVTRDEFKCFSELLDDFKKFQFEPRQLSNDKDISDVLCKQWSATLKLCNSQENGFDLESDGVANLTAAKCEVKKMTEKARVDRLANPDGAKGFLSLPPKEKSALQKNNVEAKQKQPSGKGKSKKNRFGDKEERKGSDSFNWRDRGNKNDDQRSSRKDECDSSGRESSNSKVSKGCEGKKKSFDDLLQEEMNRKGKKEQKPSADGLSECALRSSLSTLVSTEDKGSVVDVERCYDNHSVITKGDNKVHSNHPVSEAGPAVELVRDGVSVTSSTLSKQLETCDTVTTAFDHKPATVRGESVRGKVDDECQMLDQMHLAMLKKRKERREKMAASKQQIGSTVVPSPGQGQGQEIGKTSVVAVDRGQDLPASKTGMVQLECQAMAASSNRLNTTLSSASNLVSIGSRARGSSTGSRKEMRHYPGHCEHQNKTTGTEGYRVSATGKEQPLGSKTVRREPVKRTMETPTQDPPVSSALVPASTRDLNRENKSKSSVKVKAVSTTEVAKIQGVSTTKKSSNNEVNKARDKKLSSKKQDEEENYSSISMDSSLLSSSSLSSSTLSSSLSSSPLSSSQFSISLSSLPSTRKDKERCGYSRHGQCDDTRGSSHRSHRSHLEKPPHHCAQSDLMDSRRNGRRRTNSNSNTSNNRFQHYPPPPVPSNSNPGWPEGYSSHPYHQHSNSNAGVGASPNPAQWAQPIPPSTYSDYLNYYYYYYPPPHHNFHRDLHSHCHYQTPLPPTHSCCCYCHHHHQHHHHQPHPVPPPPPHHHPRTVPFPYLPQHQNQQQHCWGHCNCNCNGSSTGNSSSHALYGYDDSAVKVDTNPKVSKYQKKYAKHMTKVMKSMAQKYGCDYPAFDH